MRHANKLPLFAGVFTTPLQLGSYSVSVHVLPFEVHQPRVGFDKIGPFFWHFMLLALPFFWPNYANFYALLAENAL